MRLDELYAQLAANRLTALEFQTARADRLELELEQARASVSLLEKRRIELTVRVAELERK